MSYEDEFVYADEDQPEDSVDVYAQLTTLGDLGLYTASLRETNMPKYDAVFARIVGMPEGSAKDDLKQYFADIQLANHNAPLPELSDEAFQRLVNGGTVAASNGNKGSLRLAVRDGADERVVMSYSLRELALHVANEGWVDPYFGRAFLPCHVERAKEAFAAANGCFTYAEPRVLPLHTFGTVTIVPDASRKLGSVGLDNEVYSELVRSEFGASTLVCQVSGPAYAVFCTPEPAGNCTAVKLHPSDYAELIRRHTTMDDDFELHVVTLPTATKAELSETVDPDAFMRAFDASGATLLRVGDVYAVDGTEVTVKRMEPASATTRPPIGSLTMISVDFPPPLTVGSSTGTTRTDAAAAFLERRKRKAGDV